MKIHAIVGGCAAVVLVAGLAGAAGKSDAAKGKEIFEQCSVCHNVDNPDRKVGPSLKGLFKHDKLHNGKPVTEASVRALINAGGNGMPAYQDMLSEQDKDDVIAYLKTI